MALRLILLGKLFSIQVSPELIVSPGKLIAGVLVEVFASSLDGLVVCHTSLTMGFYCIGIQPIR